MPVSPSLNTIVQEEPIKICVRTGVPNADDDYSVCETESDCNITIESIEIDENLINRSLCIPDLRLGI